MKWESKPISADIRRKYWFINRYRVHVSYYNIAYQYSIHLYAVLSYTLFIKLYAVLLFFIVIRFH